MSASYALEKFTASAEMMATSAQSLQKRLHMAFMSFHPVKADDMPSAELRDAYERLMVSLTTVKDAETGYVPATTSQMRDAEAEDAAGLIWQIYSGLRRWRADNPGSLL
ncbi:hypothetical protein [Shinella sp.]|uniref:hypothetical protein n=1 Tax=Shinella sp. TaxID=1870904 RepID=UPI0028A97B93|nr:hypothetical protein [Shinella sp.]